MRRLCSELDVQRLDESVALDRVHVEHDNGGRILEFVYRFECTSDGTDRCRGEIGVRGMRVCWATVDLPNGRVYLGEGRAQ